MNYWGRIPAALQENGARVFYGENQSALSVEDSAKELTRKIKEIVNQTGCGKLKIIAHSKGGIDARYEFSKIDCSQYIALQTAAEKLH